MSRTLAALALLIAALILQAQDTQSKKPIPFAGHVESVNVAGKSATVKHGDIPGFMGAMTMEYPVEDEATAKKLSPGDDIVATVYSGDETLHKVRVVKHASKKKQ